MRGECCSEYGMRLHEHTHARRVPPPWLLTTHRRLALPVQAAQAGGARTHVHAAQEAEGVPLVPGGGAPAPRPPPRPRPQHEDSPAHRLPQRGQVQLHEQGSFSAAAIGWGVRGAGRV